MPDENPKPAAELPRKKADVWAHEKKTPCWQLAAARLVHAWAPNGLMTEHEFQDAIDGISKVTSG